MSMDIKRPKTQEDLGRERMAKLEEIRKEEMAKKRSGEITRIIGRATDKIAAEEGCNRRTVETSINAVRIIDKATADGDLGFAQEIRQMLNDRGPNVAGKYLSTLGLTTRRASPVKPRKKVGEKYGGKNVRILSAPSRVIPNLDENSDDSVKGIVGLGPVFHKVLDGIANTQESAREIKKLFPYFEVTRVDELCKELNRLFGSVPTPCTHCKGMRCARCSGKGWYFQR